MKKLFSLVLFSFLLSVIFSSCNKDDAVSPGNGNNNNTGPVTQTFSSNIPTPIPIAPNTFTSDSLNANITFGINASNVSDVKLNLNTLEGVIVSNLRFALFHNGVEVFVIDNPLTVSGTGNITNLVLSDSSSNLLSNVSSYPISGIYRPQHLLSSFDNLGASGYWTLRIINSGSLRTGVIKSWGITLSYMPVAPPTTQIFPTAVGNEWLLEDRDTLGVILGYDTLSLINTFIYQGKTFYRLQNSDNPDTVYIINESDGAYVYGWENSIFRGVLIWKYPVNVGDKYITMDQDSAFCTSVNETVVTPYVGTFSNCIKYDIYRNGIKRQNFYVKPGVGLIKNEHFQNGSLYDYSILNWYHLNK